MEVMDHRFQAQALMVWGPASPDHMLLLTTYPFVLHDPYGSDDVHCGVHVDDDEVVDVLLVGEVVVVVDVGEVVELVLVVDVAEVVELDEVVEVDEVVGGGVVVLVVLDVVDVVVPGVWNETSWPKAVPLFVVTTTRKWYVVPLLSALSALDTSTTVPPLFGTLCPAVEAP